MAVLGLFRRSTHVAALLAVALLSLACVQSVVMQAADAAPDVAMAMCTGAATTPASASRVGVPG